MVQKKNRLLKKYIIIFAKLLSAGFAFNLLVAFTHFCLYSPKNGRLWMTWLFCIPLQFGLSVIAGCKWRIALIILIIQFLILGMYEI